MANFSEKIKDFGRTIIGEKHEVEFKNNVEKYMTLHGLSQEEAEKTVLTGLFTDARREIGSADIDPQAVEFKKLEAAINEIFGKEEKDKFKTSGKGYTYTPPSFPHGSLPLIRNINKHYSRNYSGKIPNSAEVRSQALGAESMDDLLGRLLSHTGITGGPGDLKTLFSSHPRLQEMLGRVLLEKELLEKAENKFEASLQFEKSVENLKTELKNTLSTIFGKPLGQFLKSGWNFTRKPSVESGFNMMSQSVKYGFKGMTQGGKLLLRTVQAGYSGAKYAIKS